MQISVSSYPSRVPKNIRRLTVGFSFIQASGHSQTKLRTSRETLTLVFSYFRVMPEFLDFLFVFGEQIPTQDPYCSGFHQCTRPSDSEPGLEDSSRSWRGADLQLCYSLQSVEPSPFQEDWPWSIRHCAVHHTFDAESARSTWVVIKGDDSICKRIQSVTGEKGLAEFSSFDSIDKAFAAALATHCIICDWSSEHWRLYIRFLEQGFDALTDEAKIVNADVPSSTFSDADRLMTLPRSETQETIQTRRSRVFSWKSTQTQSQATEHIPLSPTVRKTPPRIYTNASGKKQPLPPAKRIQTPKTQCSPNTRLEDEYGQQQFSFRDLQKVNQIEDCVNNCVLVLKLNINVVTQLKDYYLSLMRSDELPQEIRQKCTREVTRFERRIDAIVRDFQLQITRAEGLLRLLADRKALVISIASFQ